jgi:hypothetical protein
MGYPLDNSKRMEEAKNYIINILKMEGYKLNSGDLFVAFKEAGGKMEDFKSALEELTQENKIQSDNDGNIMTVEDYQREQSQQSDEEKIEDTGKEIKEEITEGENENELQSIIKLKEETDSWLIEKLKNNGTDDELKAEVVELKERVLKLEKIIKNLTRAFDDGS